MSFILDALKKSETDRQRQSSPALFEVKIAKPRRRFPFWAVGLAVLLGVNLLALAWVLLRKPDAAAQTAAVPPPASAQAPAAAQSGMVTVQIPVGAAPNITVGGAPVGGTVAPSVSPAIVEEPLLEGQQPAVPPDYDARDYRPAITPEQAGAIAAARRSGALPSREDILAEGTQLPDLRLDLHVYDANPANRFVFINMRKLREGESLPDGVRVEQITPTGVELHYRGKNFSIAGN
jgi:general secretion pathway protein B